MSTVRAVAIAATLLTACSGVTADGGLQLRHTCYLALLGPEGGTISAAFQCIQKGAYADLLEYSLIDNNGDEVTGGTVGWGEAQRIELPVATPGLHLIELSTGWNVGTCSVEGLPFGYIMTQRLPMQTVGTVQKLYFTVPEGATEFTAYFSASVTHEGVRFSISDPDGKEAALYDGDADTTEKLEVSVPDGQDGEVWSFSLTSPQSKGMHLDDVMTWFSPNIPPFACEQPQWPGRLATRGDAQ